MPQILPDSLLVIFGATGDLAKRKLIPALFSLYDQGALEHASILAIGRKAFGSEAFRTYLRDESTIPMDGSTRDSDGFLKKVDYLELPIGDPAGYGPLRKYIEAYPEKNIIFYLSVPPELFKPVIEGVTQAGLNIPSSRVAFEKPFGSDLQSATELNAFVS